MESQLILFELKEHTIGNLSLACDTNVQLNEVLVPFMGQVSVSVKFPSNWKLNSSKSASVEGEDDALTELWILHTLPITWMSWPNILVFLESTASWERRMYVDLFPYFWISFPFTIVTSMRDL